MFTLVPFVSFVVPGRSLIAPLAFVTLVKPRTCGFFAIESVTIACTGVMRTALMDVCLPIRVEENVYASHKTSDKFKLRSYGEDVV